MVKPANLQKFSFPSVKVKGNKAEIRLLAEQTLENLDREHDLSGILKADIVQHALQVAFDAERCGLSDYRNRILYKLGLKNFFDELDFMETARQQRNLFYAYFGYAGTAAVEQYPEIQRLQRFLAKLVYMGTQRAIAQKKIYRKINYRMPTLMFRSRKKIQLLKETLTLIDKNPFFNSRLIFARVAIKQAARFRKYQRPDAENIARTLNRAQNKILRLATLATRGYIIDQKYVEKIRRKLWKGGVFSRGLKATVDGNLLMTLFNTYCLGIRDFLTIMGTPGKLKTAEKLRKKGIEDDANYLKAAAIYLRYGEIGRAMALHSDLYSHRPIFLAPGAVVDKSGVADEIGTMINNFQKWDERVRMQRNGTVRRKD